MSVYMYACMYVYSRTLGASGYQANIFFNAFGFVRNFRSFDRCLSLYFIFRFVSRKCTLLLGWIVKTYSAIIVSHYMYD